MRKRPRPDQIAAILRDFQADLGAGLNINQARRKAVLGCHPPPTIAGRPFGKTHCQMITYKEEHYYKMASDSISWWRSWLSIAACRRRP